MALFRLAPACTFKDLCHLVQGQVLWPTHLDHPIACTRVLQGDADKTSNILHGYKVNRVVATPKDGGLALLQNGLADQLSPEVHVCAGADDGETQATGAQILLCAVLDTEELQRGIGAGTLNRNKNEMLHVRGSGCIDQVAIARVINRVRIVIALSVEGMGRSQHLLDPLEGAQKGGWIAQVATHYFCSLPLQMSKVERGSGHHAYCFALSKQALSNNAAETATGPNDQDHLRLLSH